ncbi:hypothetical protein [Salinigranum sp. GCM10025319]|uniref:hypothetical protein n=1 Tax=Salinigranum sp. GCM10025319 TaxID=3252687 RepID=UPI003607B9BC
MTDTTNPTDATQDDGTNVIKRGKDAAIVAEAARDLTDAIEFEELRGDDTVGDPVDAEQLAEALGRPIGRLIALQLVDDTGATGFAKRTVTERIARDVSTKTFRVVVENVDTEAVAETLVELDEETLPGPALHEYVGTGTSGDARSD